jgi:hypothetical protein
MKLSQLSVDRGQGYVQMSLAEFFALPLVERIQLLLGQRLRFYDERANLIPLNDGLKLLREAQSGPA